MPRNSKEIKKALVSDLVDYSDLLDSEQVDHWLVEPEELDDRDDVGDRQVNIYFGTREDNINVDARVPYSTLQEIIVQVYVQAHRMKGSEASYEDLYDNLTDDVFDWIHDLADNNRIYSVHSKLRVPRVNEGQYFISTDEPVRTGKNTYTRFRFQPIRKSN